MDYGKIDGGYLYALLSSDGTVVPVAADGSVTLTAATYYIPFASSYAPTVAQAAYVSLGLSWAAAVAGTITIEATNFPAFVSGQRGVAGSAFDVSDWKATDWTQVNPSTAYVPVTGTGNSATLAVVTAGGTNAGTALYDLVTGMRRWRSKLVLSVGGKVWANAHGKVGA